MRIVELRTRAACTSLTLRYKVTEDASAQLFPDAEAREDPVEHVFGHRLAGDFAIRCHSGAQVAACDVERNVRRQRCRCVLERLTSAHERLQLTRVCDERSIHRD